MLLWLTTLVYGCASALLPFLNMELYIIGVGVAEDGTAKAIALGIAAGAGATVGKVIWYEVARRGAESEWAQKKLSKPKVKAAYDKWTARMQGRPIYAVVIIFLSASVGIPPLLAMAAVCGLLKMPLWAYIPTVFVGRTIRFTFLFLGVDVALH